MTCETCGQDLCVCVKIPSTTPISMPAMRATYQPRPIGINKEEFGVNLYETIKTIGGLLGLEQQRVAAIHYGHKEKLTDLATRRNALRAILAKQLPTLKHDEMDRVLATYPWVVTQ